MKCPKKDILQRQMRFSGVLGMADESDHNVMGMGRVMF